MNIYENTCKSNPPSVLYNIQLHKLPRLFSFCLFSVFFTSLLLSSNLWIKYNNINDISINKEKEGIIFTLILYT